ncbi:MAG: hypothetical protein ACI4M6_06135 [Christensenellaceae bacterium]
MENRIKEIFGLNDNFTDEELEQRYRELVEKYSEERFLEGEPGNTAARRLTEIKTAYSDYKRNKTSDIGEKKGLSEADKCIRDGDLDKAQHILDIQDERSGEWHYLQAVIYYKKNWHNECKKQLEIAMKLEPANEKYKTTYDKLVAKIKTEQHGENVGSGNNSNLDWNKSQSGNGRFDNGAPQMGGDSCVNFCCEFLACNALLNCLCNGCC